MKLRGFGRVDFWLWAAAAAAWLVAAIVCFDSLRLTIETYTRLPIEDQWETVIEYAMLRDGRFGFQHLVAQHNEHRLVLPRLSYFADYIFANGTNRLELVLVWLAQIAQAVMLVGLLKAAAHGRAAARWIAAAAVVGLLASIGQWQNLTWGFQTQFVGVFAFVTGAYILLARAAAPERDRRGALAAFCGAAALLVCSTFTMANGLMATGVAILLCLALRAPVWMTAALAALLAAMAALYFHGYHPIAANSTAAYAMAHPVAYVAYVLAYLGNPLGDLRMLSPHLGWLPWSIGAVAAVAGAAAILLAALRRADRAQTVVAAIILFLFVTAALTALGRLSFGIELAYSSRYRTPVGILWASLLIFWVRALPPAGEARPGLAGLRPVVVASALVLGGLVFEQAYTRPAVAAYGEGARLAEDALLAGTSDLAALQAVYPRPDAVLERAPLLLRFHKSIYGEPRAAWLYRPITDFVALTPGVCRGALDAATRVSFGEANALRVTGWALDSRHRPVRRIVLANQRLRIIGFATGGALGKAGFVGSARSNGGQLIAFALLPGGGACEVGRVSTVGIPFGLHPKHDLAPTTIGESLTASVAAETAWTPEGTPPQVPLAPSGAGAYASWSGNDSHVGAIRFGPFQAKGPSISVGVVTGPDPTGQSIVLRDAQTHAVLSTAHLIGLDHWNWLSLDLPAAAIGRPLLLEGVDDGSGWGQWMGLTAPHAAYLDAAPHPASPAPALGKTHLVL